MILIQIKNETIEYLAQEAMITEDHAEELLRNALTASLIDQIEPGESVLSYSDQSVKRVREVTGMNDKSSNELLSKYGENIPFLTYFVDWWQRQGYALQKREDGEWKTLDAGGTGNIESMVLRFLAWYMMNIE